VAKEPSERQKVFRTFAATLGIGWLVVLPIVAGALLGHLLDKWLGTAPVFLIVFLLTGLGAGFYGAYKQIMKIL
jgi:ATP synthase protein I